MAARVTTMTLADFLLARIAEDESAAGAATPGPWVQGSTHYWEGARHEHVAAVGSEKIPVANMNTHPVLGRPSTPPRNAENSDHIARHDPARVLAECEAKRRIVELHSPQFSGLHICHDSNADDSDCEELRALGRIYADHPDYQEAWRP